MKYLKRLTLAASIVLASSGAYATEEAPSISYNWKNIKLSTASCLKRAKKAMGKADFSFITRKSLVVGSNFNSGFGYKGTVVCMTGKRIVFFIVSGPDFSMTQKLTAIIKKNF